MKIRQWNKGDGAYENPGIMIIASKYEAISLIRNLAQQIERGNCNDFRKEFFTEDGKQFSIAIIEEEKIEHEQSTMCNICGTKTKISGSNLCDDCEEDDTCGDCFERYAHCVCDDSLDYDACGECGEFKESCTCEDDEYCDECGGFYENCLCDRCNEAKDECEDDLDEEFVSDTFKQMSAFDRARWNKANGK